MEKKKHISTIYLKCSYLYRRLEYLTSTIRPGINSLSGLEPCPDLEISLLSSFFGDCRYLQATIYSRAATSAVKHDSKITHEC